MENPGFPIGHAHGVASARGSGWMEGKASFPVSLPAGRVYTILDFRFWIVDCHAGQHNA